MDGGDPIMGLPAFMVSSLMTELSTQLYNLSDFIEILMIMA